MNVALLAIPAATLYIIGGLSTGLRLFNAEDSRRPPRMLGIALGFAGLALHAAVIYHELFMLGGLNMSFFNAVSLAAWTMAGLLLVSSLSKPVENLAILALPLAAITVLLDLRFPGSRLLSDHSGWELRLHVLTSMLAYSLLTLASAQALLLAVQDTHLRRHHPGGFIRALPPLQTMESLLFEMISVGFVLLSVALLTGFLYLDDMFAQHLVHKTVLSIVAWIAFATLLWGRFRFGWRGRKAIRWTLVGFAVLMLAYFGSKAVIELILHR
ncbi:MAG: cytochrome c biogenesis protein CcsA [Gammaproteobacteria bacterium]|nr:cytochrome c biogenesis protein CcsA [Gammaproteobacteria bacterium]